MEARTLNSLYLCLDAALGVSKFKNLIWILLNTVSRYPIMLSATKSWPRHFPTLFLADVNDSMVFIGFFSCSICSQADFITSGLVALV